MRSGPASCEPALMWWTLRVKRPRWTPEAFSGEDVPMPALRHHARTAACRTVLLLLTTLAVVAQKPAEGPAPGELKLQTEMQKLAAQQAQWCLEHRQCEEGLRVLAEAGESPAVAKLKKALESATPAVESPLLPVKRKEWRQRRAVLGLQLMSAALKAQALARAQAAFVSVREDLEPARAVKALVELVRAARDDKDVALASRILLTAESALSDSKERLLMRTVREELALREGVLLKAEGRPMVAWVALPVGWKAGAKDVAVQVALEGAGSNFLGALRNFRQQRGERNVILVVPCTLSNTNALDAARYPDYDAATLAANEARDGRRFDFDAQGLTGILEVLRRDYGAAPRFSVTGFSGGGMLTWWWILHRPADLEHALLACGNFQGPPPADKPEFTAPGPDIHLLIGEKDGFNEEVFGQKPGIIGQTDAGEAAARAFGLSRITRRVISGAGHDSFAAEVWKLHDPLRR